MDDSFNVGDCVVVQLGIFATTKDGLLTDKVFGIVVGISNDIRNPVIKISLNAVSHLVRSESQRSKHIFQKMLLNNEEFITEMTYFLLKPEISNLYLNPKSICVIKT